MCLLTGAIVWLLITCHCVKVHSEMYTMLYNPNMFDDQYMGCSDELENIMYKVLQKEKANEQFKDAWIQAAEHWYDISDNAELPLEFKDEHGIALLTFTNQYPVGNPIHNQLNGNLSIAGASRKDYMERFHFKALHFYLTRALQILKPNCDESYTTYRGSKDSFNVRPLFKFGRFTSSSLKVEKAAIFGTESLFQITTCFGATIGQMSFFPLEQEILIPPTEKFLYVKKQNSYYVLRSTGEMCSYFNCAYLGAEKQKDSVCRSVKDTDGSDVEQISVAELEERVGVLEHQITQNLQYWNDYHYELEAIHKKSSENSDNMALNDYVINGLLKVSISTVDDIEDVKTNEREIVEILSAHQEFIKILNARLTEQQELIDETIFMMDDLEDVKTNERKIIVEINAHQEIFKSLNARLTEQQDLIDETILMKDDLKDVKSKERKIFEEINAHQEMLQILNARLTEQQGVIQGLAFSVVTLAVLGASALVYIYRMRRFGTAL